MNLLSPAGEDLAEIKQQEQQIVNLLNEQRRQENELQRLHVLQQQRLEEQSNSFTHERKVCSIPARTEGLWRFLTQSLMSRIERMCCLNSTSYLAGLFDIFILLYI